MKIYAYQIVFPHKSNVKGEIYDGSISGLQKMEIPYVPTIAGAATGVAGVVLFGLGSQLAFGAAYAGYQVVNRACQLASSLYNGDAMCRAYASIRFLCAVAGIGAAALIMSYTALPMTLAIIAGCATMQILDLVSNVVFMRIVNEPYYYFLGDLGGKTVSTGAFAAGALATTALSSVCPVPGVSEAAGVATAALLEFAIANIVKKCTQQDGVTLGVVRS